MIAAKAGQRWSGTCGCVMEILKDAENLSSVSVKYLIDSHNKQRIFDKHAYIKDLKPLPNQDKP
jgi:hypothetical protein